VLADITLEVVQEAGQVEELLQLEVLAVVAMEEALE
jgi:hypothetical protein